jgi:hypothetical protein
MSDHSTGFKPGGGGDVGIMPNEGMSAQVKLSRAWDREKAKSTASIERAKKAKEEFEKEWKEKQEKKSQESNPIKEANAKKRTLKNSNPCWTGYHPVGTKNKGSRTVPNCVPANEAVNAAQQAAIAINMKKAGKKPKNKS